jgi:hypothetical protein
LVVPIIFKKVLLGAIQLINRTDGSAFTTLDGESVTELAKILGIALYNQKRMAKSRPTKFDYLLENNILTQKEIDKAIADARQRKEPIENVLMNELKISKKDIGQSLSKFCKAPFVEFNKNAPIPGDLLAGLKVPFMRKNAWVPLKTEDDKIFIAIDNPHDLQRVDSIKSLFAGKKLAFNVCLKEDVLEYIGLFTTDEKEMASMDEIMAQLARKMMRSKRPNLPWERKTAPWFSWSTKSLSMPITGAHPTSTSSPIPANRTPRCASGSTVPARCTRRCLISIAMPFHRALRSWPNSTLPNAASPRTARSSLKNTAVWILNSG